MEHLRIRIRASRPLVEELLRSSLRLPGLIILELFARFHLKVDEKQTFHDKIHNEFQTWIEYLELSQFIKSRNFDVVLENVLNFAGNIAIKPTNIAARATVIFNNNNHFLCFF